MSARLHSILSDHLEKIAALAYVTQKLWRMRK